MARIRTAALIDAPIETVYSYVTTPANWPRWHPSSLAVHGDTDHSLAAGEAVTEDYRVAGREGQVVWTVVERDAPRRWVIDGRIVGRSTGGTVTYHLTPQGNSTHFKRTFEYPTPGLRFRILDWLFLHRQVQAESAEAVRHLKTVLERENNDSYA